MKKNLVVVGGGTAGWLAALHIKKHLNHIFEVTVVESSKIGILGAGEGSTPALIGFLRDIDISISDLIKNTDCTIKNGIKFINWNGNGDQYFHGFNHSNNIFQQFLHFGYPLLFMDLLCEDKNLDSFSITSKISNLQKVPFKFLNNKPCFDPVLHFEKRGEFSIHFDARKLAEYLKQVSLQRDIEIIDGEVIDQTLDENQNIVSLKIRDVNENIVGIPLDFLIDCTGFRRKFIGDLFCSEWNDYSKLLPVDSAIPFFIDIKDDQEIPPYTEAIAMKYGWMWKIPTQSRFGCGYVYDSSFLSEDDAKKEVEDFIQTKINFPRSSFKFKPGFYSNPWKNNCLALGLASSFIEPLEATSIWNTLGSLMNFVYNIDGFLFNNEDSIKSFNEKCFKFNESIFNFVFFHYLTKRTDTEFWKNFHFFEKPEILKKFSSKNKNWFATGYNFDFGNHFTFESFCQVGFGINYFDRDTLKHVYQTLKGSLNESQLTAFNQTKKNFLFHNCPNNFVNHRDFLQYIKNH
jgi:tryptophan halogenase